jgi:hypothetical protein
LALYSGLLVGSSTDVQIVTQMDRCQGGYQGDGNWISARRYYVTADDDLNQINSEVVEDLGEVNMADGQTLVDFVTWAIQNYPADKYALILSDHGMGWPGEGAIRRRAATTAACRWRDPWEWATKKSGRIMHA